MWSVEVVNIVGENESRCFDSNFELILYKDAEIFVVYDDYSDNH